MTMVFLGVGSNTDREQHLGRGLGALEQLLGPLDVSPVFESDAVGVLGRRFLNLVVGAETHLSLIDLTSGLKAIEAACGRRDSPSPGRITLDIDILCYGDLAGEHQGLTLPRPEVLRNAFVLWPLALLAPHALLPGSGRSHAELWAGWQGDQALWPVAFAWRGRALTPPELLEAHALRSFRGA
ncbi:MAG: 2-amino-4-hydroxy-6-hydroxymethyldihydropteridine diphosphokinase [Halopseudomonas sp.]